jgi:hypothetical protein
VSISGLMPRILRPWKSASVMMGRRPEVKIDIRVVNSQATERTARRAVTSSRKRAASEPGNLRMRSSSVNRNGMVGALISGMVLPQVKLVATAASNAPRATPGKFSATRASCSAGNTSTSMPACLALTSSAKAASTRAMWCAGGYWCESRIFAGCARSVAGAASVAAAARPDARPDARMVRRGARMVMTSPCLPDA